MSTPRQYSEKYYGTKLPDMYWKVELVIPTKVPSQKGIGLVRQLTKLYFKCYDMPEYRDLIVFVRDAMECINDDLSNQDA
jgi:hypothetical protein